MEELRKMGLVIEKFIKRERKGENVKDEDWEMEGTYQLEGKMEREKGIVNMKLEEETFLMFCWWILVFIIVFFFVSFLNKPID